MFTRIAIALLLNWTVAPLSAQRWELRAAEPITLPAPSDSNSPVLWQNGQLRIWHAAGVVFTTVGADQFTFQPRTLEEVEWSGVGPYPMWIESVWQGPDGKIFAWYHHEVMHLCPGTTLTRPEIGAAVSSDGGRTFQDLGTVLRHSDSGNCEITNGYFISGHGDFTVIPDRENRYFYFFMGSYGGDPTEQGIAVARMDMAHRLSPVGTVWKYKDGAWDQPGLGGSVTPIYPVAKSWQTTEPDALWGPSVHWNTKLESFVMLMNRSCCTPDWPQEGIYIAFSKNLEDPTSWSEPEPVLKQEGLDYGLQWYPQVIGLGPGETDSIAGGVFRLYIRGYSEWGIVLQTEDEGGMEPETPVEEPNPEDSEPPPAEEPNPEDSQPPPAEQPYPEGSEPSPLEPAPENLVEWNNSLV